MNREKKWFFLSQLIRTGREKIETMLAYTGGINELWEYPADSLYDTGAELTLDQISEYQELHDEEKINLLFEKMEGAGIRYYSREHEQFPKRLLEIADPPLGIFVKGRLPEENRPAVAIIGSRKCSVYGKEMSFFFGRELAKAGVTIVSGMALGVDGYAMRGSLAGQGGNISANLRGRNEPETGNQKWNAVTTVGVLGGGVDLCYPRENIGLYDELSKGHCILSERPLGYYPHPYDFPIRNRLISALSDVVAVIEAAEYSGTSITVERAIEQNKEVFALPGRVGDRMSDGCNFLLKNGAQVLTAPEDILQVLGVKVGKDTKNAPKASLNPEEKTVFELFQNEPLSMDDILEKSGFPLSVLPEILVRLEIKGLIRKADMAGYVKVR